MSDERTVAKETIRDWAVRIAGVEDEMYDAEGFDPGDDEQTEKLTHARGNLFDAACDLLDALGGHSGDFEGLRGEARRRKAGDGTAPPDRAGGPPRRPRRGGDGARLQSGVPRQRHGGG